MVMITKSHEAFTRQDGIFEVEREPSDAVLDLRREFVVDEMNWLPKEHIDDRDRYDNPGTTYHFTKRAETGAVLASMRLTPVDSLDQSLSFEMIAANQEFQSAIRAKQGDVGDGKLWDITRLVHPLDGSQSPSAVSDAIIELYGMAAGVSAGHVDDAKEDVYWIFTTTPSVLRFFNQTGIKSHTLAEGRLPDSDGKQRTTYFCLVDVAEAIGQLKASTDERYQHTYDLLRVGAEAAEESLSSV